MCFAIFSYYPAEGFNVGSCYSLGNKCITGNGEENSGNMFYNLTD